MPDQDAVIAITSGLRDMQAVLNLVWDKLLPGFESAEVPADDAGRAKLEQRLRSLTLKVPENTAKPAAVAGKTFTFPANDRKLEAVAIVETGRADRSVSLCLKVNGVEQRVVCGFGTWKSGRAAWFNLPEQPVAAVGAWTASNTFTVKLCLTDTPFVHTLTLKFDGDKVTFDSAANVGFGPGKSEPVTGTTESR